MKGAAAVIDSIMSVAISSMTIMIGSSHHFLFWARNAQNSLTRLSPCASAAAFSNALGLSGSGWVIILLPILRVAVISRIV
jgi:hypothetical protein